MIWTSDGRYFTVTAASEGRLRHGVGWELHELGPASTNVLMGEVLRDDGGPLPTLSYATHAEIPNDIAARFTTEAVADLSRDLPGPQSADWRRRDINAILRLAGRTVVNWQGPEWPLVLAEGNDPAVFAEPGFPAIPFPWLLMTFDDGAPATCDAYQEDSSFGLRVRPASGQRLENYDPEHYRLHPHMDLPVGDIDTVWVVIDVSVIEWDGVAIPTEITLSINGDSILLVAADAYGPDEWHRHDEEVVVLRDPSRVHEINWIPPRPDHT